VYESLKRRKTEMLRNTAEERTKEAPFQLFFLKNDETKNVEVTEANKIDSEEVKRRLKQGESVFITRKREQKTDMGFITYELAREPWYLIRS
jgi:hypothetical protein